MFKELDVSYLNHDTSRHVLERHVFEWPDSRYHGESIDYFACTLVDRWTFLNLTSRGIFQSMGHKLNASAACFSCVDFVRTH